MPEANVASQRNQLSTDGFNHLAQYVGANVRLMGVFYIGRRSGFHQGVQYSGDAGVVGTGSQLAIRESARASLSELNIGVFVQPSGAPKT
jgi:hypothetical protein